MSFKFLCYSLPICLSIFMIDQTSAANTFTIGASIEQLTRKQEEIVVLVASLISC